MMADRLTYFLNKYKIAPYTQFSTHKGSSTNDAALTLTHNIQDAQNKGLVTTALTLDIKGYFDFINHKNLLSKMRNTKLLLPMVK
jgi:retron-type reverse transcriptase